jgi:hypothetical protein
MSEGIGDNALPEWFAGSCWTKRGRIVASVECGDDRVQALIDMNGDGCYIAHEVYVRENGLWYRAHNQDDVGDGRGVVGEAGAAWSSGQLAFIYGRAKPGTEFVIEFADDLYWVRANDQGMWGWACSGEAVPDVPTDCPRLFDPSPDGMPPRGRHRH